MARVFYRPYRPISDENEHFTECSVSMPVWLSRGFLGASGFPGFCRGLWLGVGWGLARGGFVEEPAIQDAKPVTHATETFLGAPRALTRLLV
jgi:hypothetical protein